MSIRGRGTYSPWPLPHQQKPFRTVLQFDRAREREIRPKDTRRRLPQRWCRFACRGQPSWQSGQRSASWGRGGGEKMAQNRSNKRVKCPSSARHVQVACRCQEFATSARSPLTFFSRRGPPSVSNSVHAQKGPQLTPNTLPLQAPP